MDKGGKGGVWPSYSNLKQKPELSTINKQIQYELKGGLTCSPSMTRLPPPNAHMGDMANQNLPSIRNFVVPVSI